MKSLLNILCLINIFSQKVELTQHDKSSYSWISGIIVSFMVIVSSVWLVYDPFIDYIYQKNPLIFTEKKFNTNFVIPILNHKANDFSVYINTLYISKLTASPIVLEKICPVLVEMKSINSTLNLTFLTDIYEQDQYYIWCRYKKPLIVEKQNYQEINSTTFLMMFHNEYSKAFKSDDELYIANILFPQANINASYFNQLISFTQTAIRIPLIATESSVYNIKLMRETFAVSGSHFFNKKNNHEYNNYPVKDIELIGKTSKKYDMPYASVLFNYDKTHAITYIKYLNEQDIISAIGGSFGLMVSIGSIINSLLQFYDLEAKLINSYYDLYYKRSSSINHYSASKQILGSSQKFEISKDIKEIMIDSKKNKYNVTAVDLFLSNCSKCKKSEKLHIVSQLYDSLTDFSDFETITKQSIAIKKITYTLWGCMDVEPLIYCQPIPIDTYKSNMHSALSLRSSNYNNIENSILAIEQQKMTTQTKDNFYRLQEYIVS